MAKKLRRTTHTQFNIYAGIIVALGGREKVLNGASFEPAIEEPVAARRSFDYMNTNLWLDRSSELFSVGFTELS